MVTLSFLTFDIEGGSCRYDFVEVSIYKVKKKKYEIVYKVKVRVYISI